MASTGPSQICPDAGERHSCKSVRMTIVESTMYDCISSKHIVREGLLRLPEFDYQIEFDGPASAVAGCSVDVRCEWKRTYEGGIAVTAAKLLLDLERLRIGIRIEGEHLRFRAPPGAMSEELRHRIELHKTELIRLLQEAARLSRESMPANIGDDDLPLTPNQVWYLNTFDPENHTWAMTLALDVPWAVSPDPLRKAAQILLDSHDVFRLRFYRSSAGRWAQRVLSNAGASQFFVYDMSELDPEEQRRAMHEAGRRAQASLSIIDGPVIVLALCQFGELARDKILISIHHHVVDGYSLNLVIEGLLATYQRLAAGQAVKPSATTSSYRDYLIGLHAYTHQPQVIARTLSFWRDPARLRTVPPLPRDLPSGQHTDVNSRRKAVYIETALRDNLAQYVRSHNGVFFNDLLLFAFTEAYHRWAGECSVRVDLEYHVRSGLLPGFVLLDTVGPATIKFPMLLSINLEHGATAAFEELRSSLRETAENALGYGFLRYTCADPALRRELAAVAPPQILINNRTTLSMKKSSAPPSYSAQWMSFAQPGARENPVSYDLMVECDNFEDSIVVTWVYSAAIHCDETINALSEHFFSSLSALIQQAD
jgi:hypothetical protein